MPPFIYLASSSPRRRALLRQIGVRYRLLRIAVDETPQVGETPAAYVTRLAMAKAQCGWRSLGRRIPAPVLGADTIVVCAGMMLGKPQHREQGLAMLAQLSGNEHQVLSAVALVSADFQASKLQTSTVYFRDLSAEECSAYWESGEPQDKAGAYAIQGHAASFISAIHGSYSGVMGLPLFETAALLREQTLGKKNTGSRLETGAKPPKED